MKPTITEAAQSICWLCYRLDVRGSIPGRRQWRHFAAASVARPASYPAGTGVSFPGGKAAEGWNWPFTST